MASIAPAHALSVARRPWIDSPARALLLALVAALLVGIFAAATNPLVVAVAMVGAVVLGLVGRRPLMGLFVFAAVVATLPFGVVPVRLGVQLTFVDVTLIVTYLSLLAHALLKHRRGPPLVGTAGAWLVLYVGVAVAALLVGSGHAGLNAELVRRFAKLMASMLLFLVAINLLRAPAARAWLGRALMAAGACAGAVGTLLWLLPSNTQLRLLTALSVIGYPTSDVLRYVPGPNNTYTTQLRATGTAVDPNVFGGTLMLAMALILLQWASRAPVLRRSFLVLLGAPTLAGILVSFSRGSWLGLAVGVLLVATLTRSRRLWLLAGLAAVALLVLPSGRDVITRFVSGFSSADRATAFRFGEYHNALTLVQRYPWLGIGFGESPDSDVPAGVSSMYLLVAEQTGLVGLGVFLTALIALFVGGIRALRASQDEVTRGLLAGTLAAFVAALVAGLLDHYFANQVFPHSVALFWLYAALLAALSRPPDPPLPAPEPAPSPPGARAFRHRAP